MDTQNLLEYLTKEAPPTLPTQNTTAGSNTTSSRYSWRDIQDVSSWIDFNYNTIIQQYRAVLTGSMIAANQTPNSPARAIRDEALFHARFVEYVSPRIRRALRSSFENLSGQGLTQHPTRITFDPGSPALLLDNSEPDMAFVKESDSVGTGANRCPGDLKVSWKWKSAWRYSTDLDSFREYKQALSQLNFYMKQHKAKYGYLITDTEMVAVKRLPQNGHLAVANAVPWTAHGSGVLTAPLALWYLGMLAAKDDWQMPTST